MKYRSLFLPLIGLFFSNLLSAQLNVTAMIASNYNNADITCFGASDGAVIAVPSGGTGPYTYQWDAATGNQTTQTATGLADGPYSVTVIDATMAIAISSVTVMEPALLTPSIVFLSHVTCNGLTDGEASLGVNGGTGTISVFWPDGQTTGTVTGLAAGNYTVTMTDLNACSATINVPIAQPSPLNVSIVSQNNVSCYNGTDGSATAMATGGTAPYNYVWTGSIVTHVVQGLSTGGYCVTATDMAGCTATACTSITQPSAITVTTASVSNPLCNGSSDGSIQINVIGGTPAYVFLWNNGQIGPITSGLSAGAYCVDVTDANGCTAPQHCITITDPAPVQISFSNQNNVSCNGRTDGSVQTAATGGTGFYTFVWDNGNTIASPTDFDAAVHCVTVTDANACTATSCITVTEPPVLTLSFNTLQMTCGLNDGFIQSMTQGGTFTSPYSYQWSHGATTQNANLLSPGNYSLTVTDVNGCTVSYGPETILAYNITTNTQSHLTAYQDTFNICLPGNDYAALDFPGIGYFSGVNINAPNICFDMESAQQSEYLDTVIIRTCDGNFNAVETTIYLSYAGCVWPGDADTNQLVNNFDLLPLGQFYGMADNTRPNASLAWNCEPMTDWPAVNGQPNPKHSDTNGDGFIDDNDTLAITLNWGSFYLRSARQQQGGVPIYVDTAQTNPGDTLLLPIMLGSSLQTAAGVYGLAFTVQYDNGIVDTNSVNIDFNTSWLGTKGVDMLGLSKDFYALGEVQIGMVRIDHTTRTGSGAIGHIQLTIKDDVLKRNNRRLDFSIKNIRMIDSLGNELPVSPEPSSVLVVSGTERTENAATNFRCFPNPSSGTLFLQLPGDAAQVLKIFDARAVLLETHNFDQATQAELQLHYPPGAYFLQLQTDKSSSTSKLILKR